MQASMSSRRLFASALIRAPALLRAGPSFSSDALLLAAQRSPAPILSSSPLARPLVCSPAVRVCFSTISNTEDHGPTDAVQELYTKLLESVEARTMPPNAWLWSLISSCSNPEDIKLLFQILQKLRTFRLANLRIHSNFNCHLCMRISEAWARCGALDYGIKALWKHNVYGITPSIGSAHYLLLHAKEHKDVKLMVKIMDVLEKNSLPFQPGTADILFSICYNTGKWDLLKTYAKKFLKAGVKLHRTAFDIWMEFAAKMGDAESIWQIEKTSKICKAAYTC